MKFAFCTCVQIGLSCMESIYRIDGKLDLILSLNDHKSVNKSGRIYVDEFAARNSIPVVKINHINDKETIAALKKHKIDWLFIIGWSQIASKEVIETPNKGAIGAHPTLLPIGRGRAAIPWAIIKGLDTTGVTVFKMDEGVDTGLILEQIEVPVNNEETAATLYLKINKAHETVIEKVYPMLCDDKVIGVSQDESKSTYWAGRKPEDGELFLNMSLDTVDRLIRATTKPYPGAFIILKNEKFIIWSGIKGIHQSASFVLVFGDGKYSVFQFEKV